MMELELGGQKYTDWLQEIGGQGGQLSWIRRNGIANLHNAGRTPEELAEAVFRSERLKKAISEVAAQRKASESAIRAEAQQIYWNMAQQMHLHTAVQPIGYALAKIFSRIFSRIWVNMDQLERVGQLARDRSVPVWLPTHKSYLDFLLLSLLCYHRRIQLPAICAADDFQSSRLLGEALRRCGAFFIRRRSNENSLYWAVFAEYVQQHLLGADRPLEFFPEGQRSRTGKSVFPRAGLLQLVLEPFLRGQLYDTLFVPVTINYDRILEEQLYAHELLGQAKPKETTSALLKARQIVGDSFGQIFFTVGQPISLRQHFLAAGASAPDIRLEIRMQQNEGSLLFEQRAKSEAQKLALEIVARQNGQNVISVWPFMAMALLQNMDSMDATTASISLVDLTAKVARLISVYGKCLPEGRLHRRDPGLEKDILHFLQLHNKYLVLDLAHGNGGPAIVRLASADGIGDMATATLSNALLLSNYASIVASMLAPFCICAIAMTSGMGQIVGSSNCFKDELEKFRFLRILFSREFVHESTNFQNEFERTRKVTDGIGVDGLQELHRILMPYMVGFNFVLATFMDLLDSVDREADFIRKTQQRLNEFVCRKMANRQLIAGFPLQMVSADLIKNAFHSMKAQKVIQLNSEKQMQVNSAELCNICRHLDELVQTNFGAQFSSFTDPISFSKNKL